jgi:hypothetical protein
MKESDAEGLATHSGPELCGGGGNTAAEALAGGSAGMVWSPEIRSNVPRADRLLLQGRQHGVRRFGKTHDVSAGSKTHGMHPRFLRGNREAPRPALADCAGVRTAKPKGIRL